MNDGLETLWRGSEWIAKRSRTHQEWIYKQLAIQHGDMSSTTNYFWSRIWNYWIYSKNILKCHTLWQSLMKYMISFYFGLWDFEVSLKFFNQFNINFSLSWINLHNNNYNLWTQIKIKCLPWSLKACFACSIRAECGET